jgi:hypothetical protein
VSGLEDQFGTALGQIDDIAGFQPGEFRRCLLPDPDQPIASAFDHPTVGDLSQPGMLVLQVTRVREMDRAVRAATDENAILADRTAFPGR